MNWIYFFSALYIAIHTLVASSAPSSSQWRISHFRRVLNPQKRTNDIIPITILHFWISMCMFTRNEGTKNEMNTNEKSFQSTFRQHNSVSYSFSSCILVLWAALSHGQMHLPPEEINVLTAKKNVLKTTERRHVHFRFGSTVVDSYY